MNNPNRPTLVLWTSLKCLLIAPTLSKHGAWWGKAPRRRRPQGRGNPGCASFGFSQPILPGGKHCRCPAEDGAHSSILLISVLCEAWGWSQGLR